MEEVVGGFRRQKFLRKELDGCLLYEEGNTGVGWNMYGEYRGECQTKVTRQMYKKKGQSNT